MDVVKLLLKLLKIRSPSGQESKIGNFVYNLLKKKDFNVKKQFISRESFNVIANIGKPKIYFSSHFDTVGESLKVIETKKEIYGRGACDAKSSIAAMITAAISCKNKGYKNFGLIFTVGEELDLSGIKKIISSKMKIPFVIIGEPTKLNIVNSHYGFLSIKLIAKGKKAHSSEPKKGINAIEKLVDAVNIIKKKKPKEILLNIAQVKGGSPLDNIIPDYAEALISFRIPIKNKKFDYKKINSLVRNLVKVEKLVEYKGIFTKVPRQFSFIKKRKAVKYGTELFVYKKGIIFGPGDIKYAHGENEKVSKNELRKAVSFYERMIKEYENE